MGNRAVITFTTNPRATAVYVHWNGGLASVQGFLQAARNLGLAERSTLAGKTELLHEVCASYIGSSAYLEPRFGHTDLANGDNGTYLIDPDSLDIVQRLHINDSCVSRHGEEVDELKTKAIALACVQKVNALRAAPWFELEAA